MTDQAHHYRITAAWLVLIGATLISWKLGHSVGISDPAIVSAIIIAVAFVKVRVVFFEFMELRHAPRYMQLAADMWVILVCAALIILYLQAPV